MASHWADMAVPVTSELHACRHKWVKPMRGCLELASSAVPPPWTEWSHPETLWGFDTREAQIRGSTLHYSTQGTLPTQYTPARFSAASVCVRRIQEMGSKIDCTPQHNFRLPQCIVASSLSLCRDRVIEFFKGYWHC